MRMYVQAEDCDGRKGDRENAAFDVFGLGEYLFDNDGSYDDDACHYRPFSETGFCKALKDYRKQEGRAEE